VIVLVLLFVFISPLITFLVFESTNYHYTIVHLLISSFALISFEVFIGYLMVRKYLADIRNNTKRAVGKTIKRKETWEDYEAGSGQVSDSYAREMKAFQAYAFIIDNFRYKVDKELYENCNEGDEVNFFYAPISNYRLGIELKEKAEW